VTTLHRLLALLFLFLPATARADDIAAASRGVVRVVVIAIVDGQVVGFGHGSGVAVAPDRIVTNAHVVELAERYPDDVVIAVVPSEGAKGFAGRVVTSDAQSDLALIAFTGAKLPPATLYTGAMGEGDGAVALGYPGNVDLATARSVADYITPMTPVRSEGVLSGRRSLSGVEVLLHTASIARGNSGGPLLDRCGRVIGINSAITRGEDGDAPFGFAIALSRLQRFLGAAGQRYASTAAPCTSIEERLRADSAADARTAADVATARRDAAADARAAREEALLAAYAKATHARENVMGLAVLLLVGGALALGTSGLFVTRTQRVPATWAGVGGAAAVIAGVLVFVLRPEAQLGLPATTARVAAARTTTPTGKLLCRFQPDRSRAILSSSEDVELDWGRDGCMNGRARHVAAGGGRWERILVPDTEQTVSILAFDPATRTYTSTRYLLGATQMKAARDSRGDMPRTCEGGELAAAKIVERQSAIRTVLPPLPNEKLVYACASSR
jgi:V8-like Glu-specific endopeptidase